MIHEIGVELEARLRARACPVDVLDGPERTSTVTFGRERIVIEYDDKASDKFSPPKGTRPNPSHRMTLGMAAKVTIYAQSPASGADYFEHTRRARHILDLVLVGLEEVAKARKNEWTPTGGRFFVPPDLGESEVRAGAAYELTFTFDRAVLVQTWTGDKRPEATATQFASTTNVTGPGVATPEVGCGS